MEDTDTNRNREEPRVRVRVRGDLRPATLDSLDSLVLDRTHHLAPTLFHTLIPILLNSIHRRLQHIEEDRMIRLGQERPLYDLEIAAISRSGILERVIEVVFDRKDY